MAIITNHDLKNKTFSRKKALLDTRMSPTEHTVGIVPSMNTGTLPLTDNKLTCITCHDPHSNRYGRMLRVPAKASARSAIRNSISRRLEKRVITGCFTHLTLCRNFDTLKSRQE